MTPLHSFASYERFASLHCFCSASCANQLIIHRRGIASRHVTVSTVGVLKAMRRLTEEMPFLNLALSLHAPNQEVRLKIVPAASAHKIDRLIEAVDFHIERNREEFSRTKRNAKGELLTEAEVHAAISRGGGKRPNKVTGVMIEYILIKDVNDREEHARELGQLLSPRWEHILLNLIPYNPTEVSEDFEPPTDESIERFHNICASEPFRLHTRVRQEKGQDIAGACGQLALVKRAAGTSSPTSVVDGNAPAAASLTTDIEDYATGAARPNGMSKENESSAKSMDNRKQAVANKFGGGLKATAALLMKESKKGLPLDRSLQSDAAVVSVSSPFRWRRPMIFCTANLCVTFFLVVFSGRRLPFTS